MVEGTVRVLQLKMILRRKLGLNRSRTMALVVVNDNKKQQLIEEWTLTEVKERFGEDGLLQINISD
jgi:hypothetical protein